MAPFIRVAPFIRRVSNGPRQMPVWLRTEDPVMLTGQDEYPKVGDCSEIFDELWRIVEVSESVVLTCYRQMADSPNESTTLAV